MEGRDTEHSITVPERDVYGESDYQWHGLRISGMRIELLQYHVEQNWSISDTEEHVQGNLSVQCGSRRILRTLIMTVEKEVLYDTMVSVKREASIKGEVEMKEYKEISIEVIEFEVDDILCTSFCPFELPE